MIVGDWNLLLDPCVDGRNYPQINNKKAKDSVCNLIAELDFLTYGEAKTLNLINIPGVEPQPIKNCKWGV